MNANRPKRICAAVRKLALNILLDLCPVLIFLGICALPIGAFLGMEHEGRPVALAKVAQKKKMGYAIMFGGSAVAIVGATALYLADQRLPKN
jgi:hypothetical protein